jgi:hypothetical protein
VVHFVGPPIALVISSKAVLVLGEEFFQLLEFSVRCGLAAVIMSSNFELRSWAWCFPTSGGVTTVTGSQCARGDPLVSFWSRWVAFKTVSGTS